ncbi:hypothetical protein ACHAXT_010683 [Thalassiosira profunda]
MAANNSAFPTRPFASQHGSAAPSDECDVLDRAGFIVPRDDDAPNEAVDLLDDDGFPVPPSTSELEHAFERAERVRGDPAVPECFIDKAVGEQPIDGARDVEAAVAVQRPAHQHKLGIKAQTTEYEYDEGGKDGDKEDKESGIPSEHLAKHYKVSLRQVFQFGEGPRKWGGLTFGLACAAVTGMVYPAMAFVLSSTFRVLSVPGSDQFRDDIRELAFIFMIIGAIAFAMTAAQITLLETAAEEMTYSLKTRWFDALLRQDMAYYDLQDVSGTAMLISTAGSRYKNGVGRKLGEGVQFFFTFLGGFAYAFYCSWRTSLVLLAVVPTMSASILFLMKMTQGQAKRANESYAEAGSIVLGAVSAIRTVYSLNASQLLMDKYSAATERAYQSAASRVALLGLANGMVLGTVLFLRSAVLTLYGSYLLYDQVRADGCDPSGALVELNDSCEPDGQRIFGALIGMTLGAAGIPQLSLAIEALMDARAACYPAISVMERKLENEANDLRLDGSSKKASGPTLTASLPKYQIDSSSIQGKSASRLRGEICFDEVSFSYPSRPEALVLDRFSITLKPGQTIGVVGSSGSGKSTIVSLLERFYDPVSGSISFDGVDIKDLNVSSLREQIGMVNQEPKLFATTIRNNIAYGCPGASDEQIEQAAKMANAHDFIQSFSLGYDTPVGDLGGQLSGGQRQRIALARVLVKKRTLLLLDEFSSALDTESELIVQEALDKILNEEHDMTTIIVAHRLSTVQNADLILAISDGRIAEAGTHAQLLAKKGLYHRLVQAQSTERHSQDSEESDPSVDAKLAPYSEDSDDLHTPQFRFRDVHFHYPTRPDSEVFRGLNLTVRRGETLAIVGESGGGKSTIVSLMERYYDVTSGTIEFEGVPLKDLNVGWLREQMGLVSQEPVLFDASIRENILYGCPSATQDDIEAASRAANAHTFIQSFPNGYNTVVGEGQLSGGQKQRIAIARAILKPRSVLLLDEASSALDSESEHLVQAALDQIMQTKRQTTVVIAHRLSTIKNADRIAVIGGGVVREIGTWDQLMAKEGGRFRRMTMFQSLDGHKKDINAILAQVEAAEDGSVNDQDFDAMAGDEPGQSVKPNHSKRARLLAKDDLGFLAVGSLGALFAGVGFPAIGVLFGYLIELLYRPNPGCDAPGFPSCASIADEMQTTSFYITAAFCAILVCTFVGQILLYHGFGTASERMNKRVRDALFRALLRQEIAYFDRHNVSSITSQLQDDAAKLHAFSGEPLRTAIIALSSLFLGVCVSLYFMWPVALMALALIPVLAFAAKVKSKRFYGFDSDVGKEDETDSPDVVAIETLMNMRTVASLNLEQIKRQEYSDALRNSESSQLKTAFKEGSTGGIAQLCQFWAMALLYWWGGYLLSTYPDVWNFRDFLVAIFALLVSISGTTLAGSSGTTDKKAAGEAADRIFALIDRESSIDPLSQVGKKLSE